MGVDGAATMPDEEVRRRIGEAQRGAVESFYGSDLGLAPVSDAP
jgi:hypothetical protein